MRWVLLLCCMFLFAGVPNAQIPPNADFEVVHEIEGQLMPEGWHPSTGAAAVISPGYESSHAIAITGTGVEGSAWLSEPTALLPNQLYEFSFHAKAEKGGQGGMAVSGPPNLNHDFYCTTDWKKYAFVFLTPKNEQHFPLRLGQWEVNGTLQFDQAALTPVQALYLENGLGDGESIEGMVYTASHDLGSFNTNACRFIDSWSTYFNTSRWGFGAETQVTYQHALPGTQFQKAKLELNINLHAGGIGKIFARRDGQAWIPVGQFHDRLASVFPLPDALFPATNLEIQIRGEADAQGKCAFQIERYTFQATLPEAHPSTQGKTTYLNIHSQASTLPVTVLDAGNPMPMENTQFRLSAHNQAGQPVTVHAWAGTGKPRFDPQNTLSIRFDAQQEKQVEIPYRIESPGSHTVQLVLWNPDGQVVFQCSMPVDIASLHDSSYGTRLSQSEAGSLWWCPAGYKISQTRPVPEQTDRSLRLSAARGEFEPVQLVIRPEKNLTNVRMHISDLTGPSNTTLSSGSFTIKQVDYVMIQRPSDEWGCIGMWPDPLSLMEAPLTLEKGINHPFWITLKVPRRIAAGIYTGQVQLEADGWSESIPLSVRIYNFSIPRRFTVETAFGFSPHLLRRYHNLETEEELKEVVDLYYQNFRDHRISPYDPTSLHPIQNTLDTDFHFDFSEFEKAGERYFDQFGFTSFRLPLLGMGGGTFHSRHKGKIGEYEQGSAEYERLFHQYASSIEAFLKEKGWLDKAYIYWFDEPDPKDYEFVREGMDLIKRHAPGLRRMLTEQPEPGLLGSVDLWCPILDQFDPLVCAERQALGEQIWWYVCTGPKAPYPGLFIDHPAVDMRIWLWMTHKYKVEGCLVWESNYWTSSAAFPGPAVQDPWQDPMSYVSGYDNPPGFKGYWGNGDGRFIYPPKNWQDGKKRICGPSDSIRWEMLREGLEDFEYFTLIKNALQSNRLSSYQRQKAEELLTIPESIIQSRTEYTKDAGEMYWYREQLATFLEEIQ